MISARGITQDVWDDCIWSVDGLHNFFYFFFFHLHYILNDTWLWGVTKSIKGVWDSITCVVVERVTTYKIPVNFQSFVTLHKCLLSLSVSQVARFLSEEVKSVLEPYKSNMDVKIELELWGRHTCTTTILVNLSTKLQNSVMTSHFSSAEQNVFLCVISFWYHFTTWYSDAVQDNQGSAV